MTNRKTTNGYKVEIDVDQWQEDFGFYFDFDLCCKDVSRDYKLPNTLNMEDRKIDYILWNKTKEEIKDEDVYTTDDDFIILDKLKEEFNIVWISFYDHSQIWFVDYVLWREYDGFLVFEKDITEEQQKRFLKEVNAWMNWRLYCVWIYESKVFTSEDGEKIKRWDYIDGWNRFFEYDDAINSLPDYVWEIIKETESEKFRVYEDF